MAKNFIQPGQNIDWTNGGADVVSGQMVRPGALLGVVHEDLATGETGAVHIEGVFDLPKAAVTISAGDSLNFDSSGGVLTTGAASAAGDLSDAAVAVADAASGDATVWAKINAGFGTPT